MRDVSPAGLLAHLRGLIAANDGFLSFEGFMREALYHPRFGYYARRISTVGRTGDFSTSATLHSALGRAIAAWALARCSVWPKRERRHLIELGAGGGQMALSILQNMGWWQRRRLRYHIVERSEPLLREQMARLAGFREVCWHDRIESALQAADGRADIFSNEFVDAFPCVVLSWEGTGLWREIGVSWDDRAGDLVEASRPWQQPPAGNGAAESSVFEADFPCGLKPGQRVEWHREYHHWLRGWQDHWTVGCLLTVDYGDQYPAVYHRRPAGSLRAYFRHIPCAGLEVYRRVGHQDLTADVNFTDLMRWGATFGWDSTLCDQTEFLHRWLPANYARKAQADPAFDFLMSREGAGEAFKVLEQRRG